MESFKALCLDKSFHKHLWKTRFRRLLKANEIEKLKKFRIKRERKRQRFRDTEKVKIDVKSLNLQEDEAVDIYKERIEGVHPTSQKSSGLQKKSYSLSIRELWTLQCQVLGQGAVTKATNQVKSRSYIFKKAFKTQMIIQFILITTPFNKFPLKNI